MSVTESENRPRKNETLKRLQPWSDILDEKYLDADFTAAQRMRYCLCTDFPVGASLDVLAKKTLLTQQEAKATLAELREDNIALALERDHYIAANNHAAIIAKLVEYIEDVRKDDQCMWLELSALQKQHTLPVPVWNAVWSEVVKTQKLRVQGDKIMLRGLWGGLGEKDRLLCEQILAVYEETAFSSPRPDELQDRIQAPDRDIQRLLQYLCKEEILIRLSKNVIISREHIRKAQEIVIKEIEEKGQLDSADFKHSINTSRKYALAILDFLDARRVTIRGENLRRLARDYQERLL